MLRGLTQIDRDLEQARRDLERAKKLDDMVAEMREQHKHRREASEQAMAVLGREEERALAGESGPLTALWAGMPAGPVKREESRELMEAQARYEAALWDLSDLEDRLWTAKEERAGLEGVEERYQALLGEKERFLCCTGSTQVRRLVQIAKELGAVRGGLQDLKDAVQAGEAAQVQLRAMTGSEAALSREKERVSLPALAEGWREVGQSLCGAKPAAFAARRCPGWSWRSTGGTWTGR